MSLGARGVSGAVPTRLGHDRLPRAFRPLVFRDSASRGDRRQIVRVRATSPPLVQLVWSARLCAYLFIAFVSSPPLGGPRTGARRERI